MDNYYNYFKQLPENSRVTFVDEMRQPLDVMILEGKRTLFDDSKDVKVVLQYHIPEHQMCNMYDLKFLQGIHVLAVRWKSLRESLYDYACKYGDDRWNYNGFRKHMYDQYINTDRPITDQFYNLDRKNRETVFKYINDYLMNGTASYLVDSGIRICEVQPHETDE